MGLKETFKETFNKLAGKQPEPISSHERWRQTVVRDGNLDYRGKPIDANPGQPIAARPEQAAHRERVADFLERDGFRIEQRNPHIPQLLPNQTFNNEVGKAEQAHEHRFDNSRNLGKADVKQMRDFLRDGCVEPPKRRES